MVRAVLWLPGLAVALGAAVATAHGLFQVAAAAQVPAGIAWLYPLITDGLALVAYTATARLHGSAARYAWSVVVAAAGLSGLAQAVYLASGATLNAPPVLRFGIGAWPALAAAIVAHLLYLLTAHPDPDHRVTSPVVPVPAHPAAAPDERSADDVHPALFTSAVQPAPRSVPLAAAVQPGPARPALAPAPPELPSVSAGPAPARDRARVAAARRAEQTGAYPSVTELQALAEVSRGTASAVLQTLRAQPTPLHLITNSTDHDQPPSQDDDPTIEEHTQR